MNLLSNIMSFGKDAASTAFSGISSFITPHLLPIVLGLFVTIAAQSAFITYQHVKIRGLETKIELCDSEKIIAANQVEIEDSKAKIDTVTGIITEVQKHTEENKKQEKKIRDDVAKSIQVKTIYIETQLKAKTLPEKQNAINDTMKFLVSCSNLVRKTLETDIGVKKSCELQ